MKKYLISIPDDVDEKITKIALKKGITNNNEIRDTILSYYTQASKTSYSQIILDLENELNNIKERLSKGEAYEFIIGELDTIKKLERISSTMKPSAVKATIGKQFFKKVKNKESVLYETIEHKGTKRGVAFYCLNNK